jgi:hypothetical protein
VGVGLLGGEHLQDFNVSGSQEKNLPTDQACQADAVNLSIAFGLRPKAPLPPGKAFSPAPDDTCQRIIAFQLADLHPSAGFRNLAEQIPIFINQQPQFAF